MIFFPQPKLFCRIPKPRKPIKRRRTKIAAKSVFKAHGDNPLKTYRRRFTDYQVTLRAEVSRQARLRNRTRAEMAFAELLDGLRIPYEVEKIFLNGDRHILADFYFKDRKFVVELDGSAHDNQKGYDAGRDAWLLRRYGVRTIRIENQSVFRQTDAVRKLVIEALG